MDDLVDAIRQRYECCAQITALQERQTQAIGDADYQQLVAVLTDKQRWLDRFAAISRESDLVSRWKNERDDLPPGQRTECEDLLARMEDELSRLDLRHSEDLNRLSTDRGRTERQLAEVRSGGAVSVAYRDEDAAEQRRVLDIDR
ncbi:hypothetical protein [Stratiformator vulcanicus]|nr:hypothetical protein [Stratiformator vulcanicus]